MLLGLAPCPSNQPAQPTRGQTSGHRARPQAARRPCALCSSQLVSTTYMYQPSTSQQGANRSITWATFGLHAQGPFRSCDYSRGKQAWNRNPLFDQDGSDTKIAGMSVQRTSDDHRFASNPPAGLGVCLLIRPRRTRQNGSIVIKVLRFPGQQRCFCSQSQLHLVEPEQLRLSPCEQDTTAGCRTASAIVHLLIDNPIIQRHILKQRCIGTCMPIVVF